MPRNYSGDIPNSEPPQRRCKCCNVVYDKTALYFRCMGGTPSTYRIFCWACDARKRTIPHGIRPPESFSAAKKKGMQSAYRPLKKRKCTDQANGFPSVMATRSSSLKETPLLPTPVQFDSAKYFLPEESMGSTFSPSTTEEEEEKEFEFLPPEINFDTDETLDSPASPWTPPHIPEADETEDNMLDSPALLVKCWDDLMYSLGISKRFFSTPDPIPESLDDDSYFKGCLLDLMKELQNNPPPLGPLPPFFKNQSGEDEFQEKDACKIVANFLVHKPNE